MSVYLHSQLGNWGFELVAAPLPVPCDSYCIIASDSDTLLNYTSSCILLSVTDR